MNFLKLFLILVTIGYCLTDTAIIDCESEFENKLKEKCEEIGSCTYNSIDRQCIEYHQCSDGDGESSWICQGIVPKNFTFYKCKYSGSGSTSKCEEKPRECSDLHSIFGYSITGDICSQLSAPTEGKHCLLDSSYNCNENNYAQCSSITSDIYNHINICNNNIPKDLSRKCEWNTADNPSNPFCKSIPRICGEDFYNENIDNCGKLAVSNTNTKKCIYDRSLNFDRGGCKEETIRCEDFSLPSSGDCTRYKPLNQDMNGYNYTLKCVRDDVRSTETLTKCKSAKKQCKDYHSPNPSILPDLELQGIKFDESFCKQLDVSEDYFRCAYDKNKGCYEEFITCEDYTNHKVETDRDCEGIVLLNTNQKCFYNNINDTCVTRDIYHSCDEYKEGDKKTCESILSSENNQYCILDKDSICMSKPINCSEAYTKEDCLHIAKPSNSNKRCVFGNPRSNTYTSSTGKCFEEFLRCEDYSASSDYGSAQCSYIKLYDGKTCELPQGSTVIGDRCISKFKTCGQANTEEECKLIAKTGVTDPERKVCDWYKNPSSGQESCIENYKYCSDYRGDNDDDECTRIKPYDLSGNNIEYGYKCTYDESDVGCQKVPVECEDATSPVECTSFSDYIKDKEKQYCVYYGGKCTTQYKECEFVDRYSDKCSTNIIEGYIINACTQGSDGKCERSDNRCGEYTSPVSFTVTAPNAMDKYYIDLCQSINPNCTYQPTNGKCEFDQQSCDETVFYSNDTANKEICENIQVDKPYKKCVLKEDFSGCKEVYKETDYSTANISYSNPPDASTQGNSSGFIVKGIHLILALLCLLI